MTNVEALTAALAEYWGDRIGVGSLAKWLASHGVLAVDSLTDEQAEYFWLDGDYVDLRPYPVLVAENAERVRAALRRCATGENDPQ